MITSKNFTMTKQGAVSHLNYFGLLLPAAVKVTDYDSLPELAGFDEFPGYAIFVKPNGTIVIHPPVILN